MEQSRSEWLMQRIWGSKEGDQVDPTTRKYKIVQAEPPQDVKDAFNKYAEGGKDMTAKQLHKFLVDVQGESEVSETEVEKIVKQALLERHETTKLDENTLTLEDFQHYLFSADLNPPIRGQVHHAMTAPLSHYFIYTGHNSYLTGNQLSSDCSDVPIINALKEGVRVVELDLWPNSDEDDVEVLHGRTLTTPVELITCLKSIRENAFVASPYPVIITLEDHLTPELQGKAAQMINETFQEMLFIPECDCLKEFPSPEELKYRIMISTKPPEKHPQEATSTQQEKSNKQKEKGLGTFICGGGSSPKDEDKTDGNASESSQEDEDNDTFEGRSVPAKAPEYKRLIAIPAGKPKGGLDNALKVEPDKVRRLSLSEPKLEKVTETRGKDVVRFTQKNVLRIFPKGTRVDSSNYDPLIGWTHGAQMVAFNMQGNCKYRRWMQGMFRSNGRCGYLKKPEILMNVGPNGEVFDPNAEMPVKKTLKVKVYMGDGWQLDFEPTHFDSYSPPDFFTKVSIRGVPADMKKYKTKTLDDKWNPVWNEGFIFPLTVPELALLRVEVQEDGLSEEFGGQTCLLVSELKQGIRAVPLFNKDGGKLESVRLLMRFDFV